MSSYRLNLTVDEKFAEVLNFFKSEFPLLSDVEIIKMVLGEKYAQKSKDSLKSWSNLLPVLSLSPAETKDLEKNLQESINSGFSTWDKDFFINEMQK